MHPQDAYYYLVTKKGSNVQTHTRLAVAVWVILGLMASELSVAQSSPGSAAEIGHAESAVPGLHDFDFLVGRWQVHHRKLKHRLVNSHEVDRIRRDIIQPATDGWLR